MSSLLSMFGFELRLRSETQRDSKHQESDDEEEGDRKETPLKARGS